MQAFDLPASQFLLIEGNLECMEQLLDNFPAHSVRIAVLSNVEKNVEFHLMRDCPMATGCSYYKEKTPYFDKSIAQLRRTTTLDQVMVDFLLEGKHTIQTPILLKLDTQGSELDIFNGASHLLKADGLKAIICEVAHSEYNEGATNTNEAVARFMAEHGFIATEKLEDIIHPIEREKVIQSDMLYLRESL